MTYKSVDVVVGGQFGSEAKGHVAGQILHALAERARRGESVVSVRIGGPNAGHTVVDAAGVAWPLRTIPVGAVEPDIDRLVIADGSEIDIDVLWDEITRLEAAGHKVANRLWVSAEATILEGRHKTLEQERLVNAIGSTGKGIGASRADRMMRKAFRVCDHPELVGDLVSVGAKVFFPLLGASDTSVGLLGTLRSPYPEGSRLVLEGTQGYGLGLHAGMYPKVTSQDCTALDVLQQARVNPWQIVDPAELRVWVVARVYPIRVAGNSGPLAGETNWGDLGLPEELTTVTQKVRRVGNWDPLLVHSALAANGYEPFAPTHGQEVRLALTMVDQIDPLVKDSTDYARVMHESRPIGEFLDMVRRQCAIEPTMVTTGPATAVWADESWRGERLCGY